MKKIKTVQVPAWMTWERFGCSSLAYFEKYIQGKELPILEEHPLFLTLEINQEPWNVFRTDLMEDKNQAENEDYA